NQTAAFSYAKDQTRNTLEIPPEKIFPEGQWSTLMGKRGITAWTVEDKEYCYSSYGQTVGKGFTAVPTNGQLNEGLTIINKIIRENKKSKNYIYFYYAGLDSCLHQYGSRSKKAKGEIKMIKKQLARFLKQKLNYRKNTLFILTADHGQIDIDPQKTFYLNKEIPEIMEMIRENNEGKKLFIGGSCRAAFLYLKPEWIEKALFLLKEKLSKIALVDRSNEIIKLDHHQERIGDILIRPLSNYTVWWYEKDIYEVIYPSCHGGISQEEREIPFLTQELK
ncbi:MAG TPA: alkaline phosphatase family protein, partial [Candidatus Woesebacteria bacterium]|nr:alkaline phosphatase family protein [Candidatus Woesebacteria bacterium]